MALEIAATQPDVVWVGLGLPKQDEWMHRNASVLYPALLLGVGAAFDFIAGTKRGHPCGCKERSRVASSPDLRAAASSTSLCNDQHGVETQPSRSVPTTTCGPYSFFGLGSYSSQPSGSTTNTTDPAAPPLTSPRNPESII
jgi:Glycosyl transferase WecG/TagA/CpsF family